MCILVIKQKGVKFPTMKQVQACCDNNPDGFALSYSHKGKITTYKTMSKKEFLDYYKRVMDLPYKEVSMILHARIKTHGSIGIKNCHCWESDGMSFAHNGILSIKNRGDLTDSETFFRDIFLPIWRKGKSWKQAEGAINAVIGSSKFGFLEKNGEIHHYGVFQKENDILFSNSSYIPRTYVKSTYSKGVGFSQYGSLGNGRAFYNGIASGWGSNWEDWEDFN